MPTQPTDSRATSALHSHIQDVIDQVLANPQRRLWLKQGVGMAALSFMGLTGCVSGASRQMAASVAPPPASGLGFSPVAKSLADTLTVPPGYQATVLYRLGDPIAAAVPEYQNEGDESGDSFTQRAGDHHDGMHFFGLSADGRFDPNATERGLLCINHEGLTPAYLHKRGATVVDGVRTVADEVIKEMNAMGVSVIEVRKQGGAWSYVRDSRFNRRITTVSDMILSGPAARSPLMITRYSRDGSRTRGTIYNCANGYTPWGTYLTCEENWASYFRRDAGRDNPNRTAREWVALKRYRLEGKGANLWASAMAADPSDTVFSRWVAEKTGTTKDGSDDFRNAPNTFGWVVEIDPFTPTATPRKRTALGRFSHEGAWLGKVSAGKPLVWYMGCDARNEYIYKFVSEAVWDPADATLGIAGGDKYLDNGKLYVARFNADGRGEWLELRFGAGSINPANATYAFESQADVLIHASLAADALGATQMDRPEWGAVNPFSGEVYFTLTNNDRRTMATVNAANPRAYSDVRTDNGKVRRGNCNGHIIRWAEDGAAVTAFTWDIFLFGARASADADVNLSALSAGNDFSSPDGLWFGRNGLLWIETDDDAYTDVTNCMLLAALPGKVGDGRRVSIANREGDARNSIDTRVGATLGEARLRRFLVGPKECEITGISETPDGKALFINIQHPGEDSVPDYATQRYGSHWPDGGKARPRSATVVITRTDGGVIGV